MESRFPVLTESELLKGIVEDVLQKMTPTYPNQRKSLVGIEERFEEIESLLKIGSSEVIALGIWGMGGIGKTTLATALYDKFSYEFEGRCFLANVREKSDKLEALRDELFSKLLENKSHGFDNFDVIRLRRKKIFLVMDDVSTSEQLEKLIGAENDFLGAGSRVIVTTRDKQVLSTVNEVYSIEELNSNHSLHLFCLAVFGEKQPKHGYTDLSSRVISYCKGIPLALKVLGASLRNRSKEAWECELRKLEKIPNMKIHNVLKLSYDGLGRYEKEIFLDIACFFKGEKRDWVTGLLEAFDFFPASGIEVLLDKALITISKAKEIEMHDLVQEMGREIIHQESEKDPGKRSRLWKFEEVVDVLKYNKGSDVVEAIILDLNKLNADLHLRSNSLAKMTNLRFLKIHGDPWARSTFNVCLSDGLESLSDKLRFLQWDDCCLESLPPNFCAEHLVKLRMRCSNVKKLWDEVQNLVNLKEIDLSCSQNLIEIPNLSTAEKLEKVSLVYCESLSKLHLSMLSLNELDMYGCSSLKEFSVKSEKMKSLRLSGTAIRVLSSTVGHLLSLEVLDLSGANVESLPANIKNLSMLRNLILDDCKKLMFLPELPPSLIYLGAFNCISLEIDITQGLVLQHMLQNILPFGGSNHFFLPGDHVTHAYGFHTAKSLITISYLRKSDLFGFIFCFILSDGQDFDFFEGDGWYDFKIYIYQDATLVSWENMGLNCSNNLISDHVFFFYADISLFDKLSGVYDHFGNITFVFEFEVLQERLKGCGVLPVCSSTLGLNLVRETGVSNNENEGDWEWEWEQLLPASKRQR